MHEEGQEELLHQSDKGFVVHCSCCDQFQIGFGNAIIVLCRAHFRSLHESLEGMDPHKTPEEAMPNGKTHVIKSSCHSFMAFDSEEMAELQELLDGAEAGYQVGKLFGG